MKKGKREKGKRNRKKEYTPFVVLLAVETQSLLWKRRACPACC
jgi:hypothetical protein